MATEDNKAVVRRYQEIYNTNQLDALPEVLAPDFKPHTLMPGVPATLEGYKMIQDGLVAAYPDVQLSIEDLVAEGDKVVMRFLMTGTHQGDFMGIAAPGSRFMLRAFRSSGSPMARSSSTGAKRIRSGGCSKSAPSPRVDRGCRPRQWRSIIRM